MTYISYKIFVGASLLLRVYICLLLVTVNLHINYYFREMSVSQLIWDSQEQRQRWLFKTKLNVKDLLWKGCKVTLSWIIKVITTTREQF